MPMIVRWSGGTRGAVCEEPVISNDYLATIAEITGAPVEQQDGVSLVPLLKDAKSRLARRELFFHYPHYYETTSPVSAIRSGEWKLLEYFEDDRFELYNLGDDPGEKTDLAASQAGKAAELRGKLRAWRAAVNARLPVRA